MRTILLTLAVVGLALAQTPPKPPAGVPANAKMVDEDTWRVIDEKGKPWIYKRSPFGLMKSPELTEQEQRARDGVGDPLDGMSVKEDGDKLKFSRPGPFGMYTWTKKKTELDDREKAVWERTKAQKPAPATAKQ